MLFERDIPLAPLTTLRLGGRARRVALIGDEAELVLALREARSRQELVFVLGGGSNVVIADEGFDGLVLRIASRGLDVHKSGEIVRLDVAAGQEWETLVARAVAEGWSGLESLAGIPGLVGATPIQNVGAYGHDVNETIRSVRVFDRVESVFKDFAADECAFGYRTSVFRGSDRYVVTRVVFELRLSTQSAPVLYPELVRALGVSEGSRAPLHLVRDAVRELRRTKGMIVDPLDPDSASAGSFFVNPILTAEELASLRAKVPSAETMPSFRAGPGLWKVPAAWLVERAGFAKGYGSGNVGVSKKHALALVHRGGGSTRELLDLAREIRRGVKERLGVLLQPEPVLVGCTL